MTDWNWMNPEGFVYGEDYKSAHLEWIANHRNFVPSVEVYESTVSPYVETMQELYRLDNYLQEWAYVNLMRDMQHHRRVSQILINSANFLSSKDAIKGRWFITVNFNHQTFTVDKMHRYMQSLLSFDWIQTLKAKFEMFRTNGEHPHVHMLLETQLTKKSKIIEKLHRCRGGKQLILNTNFIDIKVAQLCHDKYINGDKREDKMPCVEKDIKYREEHGIPEFYIK